MRLLAQIAFFLVLAFPSFGQTVGGAGWCKTSANPNTITSLRVVNQKNMCSNVWDTLARKMYYYDYALTVGSRWVEFVPLGPPIGAETKVEAGTGIGVSGNGTIATPYIITNTGDLSNTNEIQRLDTFTIVSGVLRASLLNDGVPFSSVTLPTADGSETQINAGTAIGVSGTGTTGSPYVVTNTADLSVTAGGTNALQIALNTSGQTPIFVKGMGQVTVTESATGDTIKIGGVGGIYGVSDTTQPAHVLTIAANSTLTFQSQGDNFGGRVPFRVKSDGNEPDIQGWYANGDSLVLSRTDTEFLLSTPSGLTVASGATLSLTGDSVTIAAVGAALSSEKTYLQITSGNVVKYTEGIPLAHLNQSGATTGQVVKWNGTAWVPDTDGGGDNWGSQVVEITGTTLSGNGTVALPLFVPTGGITATQILDGTILNADVNAAANIANSKLANSGVTAGTYPSTGGVIPLLTINSKGIITSVTEVSNVDPTSTNEGVLGVGAGSGTSSVLLSNTSGAVGVTINASGINAITESTSSNGGSITISATEVDGSTTNELQTVTNTSNSTTHTVTLSNSGGSVQLAEGANITLTTTGTGADGVVTIAAASAAGTDLSISGTSSPVTLNSSTGTDVTITAGGINMISATSGNVTITATEVDGSVTNELQTLAVAANTATLSNSGGSVTVAGGGINTATTSGTTITVTGVEVDGSTTNEIQRLDTFTIVSGVLRASLLNDGVPFSSVTLPTADGSETKVNAGTGIGVSGTGTTGSPYVVTNTGDLSATNELQYVDTLLYSGDTLRLSLSLDGRPQKKVYIPQSPGGIYGTPDTTTGNHIATIAADRTLTFRAQDDDAGGIVPFRVTSTGNEPDILGLYADGDSLVFGRADTEMRVNSSTGLLIAAANTLALQGDSVQVQTLPTAPSTEKTYVVQGTDAYLRTREGIPLDHLTQSGATAGQVVKWSGTAWVADTDGGGAGGPDSTWAKSPSGVYTGKRISDNVYRTAKIGIGTTDTTAKFNIKPPAPDNVNGFAPVLEKIVVPERSAFAHPTWANSSKVWVQQIDPNAMRPKVDTSFKFGIWEDMINIDSLTNSEVNRPGDLIRDVGFNLSGASSRLARWGWSTEQYYFDGVRDGQNKMSWEHHLQVRDTLGRNQRPFLLRGLHDGSYYDGGMILDVFHISKPFTNRYALNINTTTGAWYTDAPFSFKMQKDTFTSLPLFSKLYSGSYRNLLNMHTNGRTDIGDVFGTRVTDSLSMYASAGAAQAFKISGLGPSSVKWEGKIAQESNLDETYTLTRVGNTNRMSFSTSPGNEYGIGINGNSSIYFRGTVPATRMTFLSDGNISVNGFSSQTQFAIFQPSLDRNGGIRLNPTISGTVADFFVNASNELVIHRTNEALRLANSGQLQLPEYTSSTSFPLTPVATAVFGSDGKIGTAAYSPLAGTGTANRVAYWSGTNNITSSANFLFDGTKVSANTGTAISTYLSLNPSNNASSTALNGGLTLFDNGANNLYGMDMGYGAAFGPRLFTAASADINFAKVVSGSAPTAQSDFENIMTLKGGTSRVGIGTTGPSEKLHVVGNARVTGAYYDSSNDPGTSGQILSSTVTGTDWVAASTLGDNWGSQTVTTTGTTLSGVGTAGSPLKVSTDGIGPTELEATAVTPGSYLAANVTVDADGRITAASSGSIAYQTLRDDGVDKVQRFNVNFVSTPSVNAALTDDGGNNETEVRMSVATDGITATEIAAGAVGASELSSLGTAGTYGSATQVPVFTTDADGRVSAVTNTTITGTLSGLTATRVPFASGAAALADDANLTWNNTTKRLSIGNTGGSPAASLHIAEGSVASWEPLRAVGTVSGNMITTISNAQNSGGASNNLVDLSVGGASAGDPAYRWLINGVDTWSMGLDNSDADKWKLKKATTPSTLSNVGITMTADATPLIGINNDAPLHPLHVIGRATATVLQGISGTPTHTFGSGAGTGPSLGTLTGTTNGIDIQFTTGTAPAVNGNVVSITYPTAFSNTSFPVFCAANAQTATDITKFYISAASATAMTITANGTLSASTTYRFKINISGR